MYVYKKVVKGNPMCSLGDCSMKQQTPGDREEYLIMRSIETPNQNERHARAHTHIYMYMYM